MAKIVGPDALTRGTEIIFDTAAKTIQLVAAGNLSNTSPATTSGVTLQAVYSKCKELWISESDLNTLRFPFDAITEAKMDLINGWDWLDATTKELIRDGGWSLRDSGGVSQEEWMCVISLGTFPVPDQAYFQQIEGFDQATAAAIYQGVMNEPVQIFDADATTGFNYRNFFKIYLREQGKTYSLSNLLSDQGLATLDYQVFRLPLANIVDIKIEASDATIDSQAPYTGMTIDYLRGQGFTTWAAATAYVIDDVVLDPADGRWYRATAAHTSDATARANDAASWESFSGEEQIGEDWYAFNRVINGNAASLEEIYEFAQRQLRQTTDINDNVSTDGFGTVNGNVAVGLAGFIGDTLRSNPGVVIRNFDPSDQVRIELVDITVDGGGLDGESVPLTSTVRTFPFVSAGNVVFNSVLVDDVSSEYRMYYTTNPAGNFDTTDAVIVNNDDGLPIQGAIDAAVKPFTFDYDNNTQGGRTAGTDAGVTVVALGLSGAQYVVATFTITRAVGLNFPVNAVLERNYVSGS